MKPLDTIKQIIPANGWRAAFHQEDGFLVVPLICWALFEDADGLTHVDGIDREPHAGFRGVSETRNFAGFVAPGESVEDATEKALPFIAEVTTD